METSIKRHWLMTVAYAFFFLNGVLTIGDDVHPVIQALRIVMGMFGLAGLIWSFRYKNVFEFRNNNLIWYREFHSPLTIARDDIDCILLEHHILRSSKIIMKSGKAHTFRDGNMSFSEIRTFMHDAGVPVKG